MNRISDFLVFLIGIGWISQSCTDIIVPDISDDQVILVSPNDGLLTNLQTISLVWEPLEHAEEYNLQVVSPSFDSLIQIVVDTNLLTDRFTHTFPAGRYEWSVVAFNAAFSSACCEVFSFTIGSDSSGNLTQQTILLESPSNNSCTMDSVLTFRWSELAAADQYRFEIGNAGFSAFFRQDLISASSIAVTFSQDSTYFWRVRGENSSTQTFTAWSSAAVTIDRIPPNLPNLLFPNDGATIVLLDQNPDLGWNSASDAVRDSLRIFADEQLDTLILKIGTEDFDINLDDSGVDFPAGDFFWQLQSLDKAGNLSSFSSTRRFRIEE